MLRNLLEWEFRQKLDVLGFLYAIQNRIRSFSVDDWDTAAKWNAVYDIEGLIVKIREEK